MSSKNAIADAFVRIESWMEREAPVFALVLCAACHSTTPADSRASPVSFADASASPRAPASSDVVGPAASSPPSSSTRTPLEESLTKNYCGSGMGGQLYAWEDGKGTVGGYTYSPPIPDSPVAYIDADGVVIGSFHIFSDPQTTEKVPGTIAKFQKAYPQGRLVCSTGSPM